MQNIATLPGLKPRTHGAWGRLISLYGHFFVLDSLLFIQVVSGKKIYWRNHSSLMRIISRIHTLSLSLTHALSHPLSHTYSHTHSISHALSHSLSHTHTLSLSHTHSRAASILNYLGGKKWPWKLDGVPERLRLWPSATAAATNSALARASVPIFFKSRNKFLFRVAETSSVRRHSLRKKVASPTDTEPRSHELFLLPERFFFTSTTTWARRRLLQRCCCATTSAAATKKLPRLTFGGVATAAEGRRGVAEVAVEGLGQALQRGGGGGMAMDVLQLRSSEVVFFQWWWWVYFTREPIITLRVNVCRC